MKGRALMSNGDRSTVPYIRNTYRLIGFQEVAPPIFFFPPFAIPITILNKLNAIVTIFSAFSM